MTLDGLHVAIRPIRPTDAADLQRAYRELSPTSRYRRFFRDVPELSPEALKYLTDVDGRDHVALIATADSVDLKTEVGLGVARFIRLADPKDAAEASVVVVDGMQNRGIGRCLLQALVEAAKERGIARFRAEVLASNEPMRKILGDAGASIVSDDGTVIIFDVPLEPHPHETSALAHLFRAAASSVEGLLRGWYPPALRADGRPL